MDRTTLLLAKLMSVAFAALFAGAMIDLVVRNQLASYLNPDKFELLILSGGVLLGLIVLLRLPTLFSGQSAHTHDHDHDHDHAHGEDHDHEHGVSLWRLIVLALPLTLIFMGPPKGYSDQALINKMSAAELAAIATVGDTSLPEGFELKGEPKRADWKEIVAAANDPSQQAFWQNRPVRMEGRFVPDERFGDRYRLMRIKITCCAADGVPLSLTVLGKPDPNWEPTGWVEVLGAVDFVKVPDKRTGQTQVFPVIYQIEAKETEPRPYL